MRTTNPQYLLGLASLPLVISACFAQTMASSSVQHQEAGTPPSYKSIYTRATEMRSINPPAGQLINSLPSLKEKALSGDANAAAQIYAGLSQCSGFSALVNKAQFKQQCAKITAEDMQQKGRWLKIAAENGDADAQYIYATSGYEDIVTAQASEQDHSQSAVNYKTKSQEYLIHLSEQCHYDAIAEIGMDALNGSAVFPKDPKLSYKYFAIQSLLARDDVSSRKNMDFIQHDLISNEIFDLRQQAQAFVAKHCL